MISIRKNPSFPQWIQVFAFGQFIDEVQGRANALRIATSLAKEHKQTSISFMGEVKKVL